MVLSPINTKSTTVDGQRVIHEQQYTCPLLQDPLMSPADAGAAATKTARVARTATASLENIMKVVKLA